MLSGAEDRLFGHKNQGGIVKLTYGRCSMQKCMLEDS